MILRCPNCGVLGIVEILGFVLFDHFTDAKSIVCKECNQKCSVGDAHLHAINKPFTKEEIKKYS